MKLNDKMFVCPDPADMKIAQEYMDMFAAYADKMPPKKHRGFIFSMCGGEDNFKRFSSIIKDQAKEIKKHHKDLEPKKIRSDLDDIK